MISIPDMDGAKESNIMTEDPERVVAVKSIKTAEEQAKTDKMEKEETSHDKEKRRKQKLTTKMLMKMKMTKMNLSTRTCK